MATIKSKNINGSSSLPPPVTTSSSSTSGKMNPPSTSSAAPSIAGSVTKSETASSGVPDLAPVEAQDMKVDLLPVLHDIIRIVEKDNQDVSQKNKDSLEASQKVLVSGKKPLEFMISHMSFLFFRN